jgi:uncharacterized protein (DUF58 family)
MITQRAALLGFVAFCFYLIAVVNTLGSFYFALTWAAIGIFGASLGIALLSLVGLDCKIEVKRSRASATLGNEHSAGPLVSIGLKNSGTLNKTGTIVELKLRDSQNILGVHRYVIEAVPSGAALDSELPLSHLVRGKYHLEEVRLVGSDVLGLFRIQKRVALDDGKGLDIIVGPPVLRGERWGSGGNGSVPAQSQRAVQSGSGDELRGTRPYVPGDDLRHVHWKSSARLGDLVVKEFEQTGRQAALVIWDGAQNTTWGFHGYDSTEWSLTLCASLCRALLEGGTSCDFARLDGSPLFVEARKLSGSDLPSPLIDALATASPQRRNALDVALQELQRLNGRSYSTVIIVTASLTRDVGQAALFWRIRGAPVQIMMVDGASLLGRSTERRRRGRAARPRVQSSGAQEIPVTTESYLAQVQSLRENGIQVTHVLAGDASPEIELRRALQVNFDPRSSVSRVPTLNNF